MKITYYTKDKMFCKTLIVLLTFRYQSFAAPFSEPLVQTTSGTVRGKTITTSLGKKVDAYLGIPYAQTPIGKLRFKHPLEVKPWEGTFNATEEPLTCYQKPIPLGKIHPEIRPVTPTTDFSEDCLKLNVWVPKEKPDKASIIVYIYGGGHARGAVSSPIQESSILSTEEQVIVVMMNYRVASLGFLFLNHPDVPGNAGLYDQLLALKWIKANAATFGGDPESITLFGYSSGAASVGNHLLSPLSRGLFNRAIMESGSPTSEWALLSKKDAIAKAMVLVDNMGCPHDRFNLTAIVECLLAAKPDEIIGSEIQLGYSYVYIYMPVVDGRLITEKPKESIRKGQFANVSLLTGTVKNEGSPFLLMIDPLKFPAQRDRFAIAREDAMDFIKIFEFDDLTTRILFYLYFGGPVSPAPEKSSKYLHALEQLIGDFAISCPLTEFENRFSKAGNNVYKFFFTHRSSTRTVPKWMGTIHGEDMYYVFGDPLRGHLRYSKDEEILSRRIMRYWANFARTGNPNNNTRNNMELVYWPKYTPENKEYLVLAPNSTEIGKAFREKYCHFWEELRPELLKLIASEPQRFIDDNSLEITET